MTVVAVLNHHYSVAGYVLAYWMALHTPQVHVVVVDHGLSPTMPPIIANCHTRHPVDMTPIPAIPLQPVQFEGHPRPPYSVEAPNLPLVAVTPANSGSNQQKWWLYWYYHPHQVVGYIRANLPSNVTVLSLRNLHQLHKQVGGIWFDFTAPDDSNDAITQGANVQVRATMLAPLPLPIAQWAYWSRLGVSTVNISATSTPSHYVVDVGGKLLDLAGLLSEVAPRLMVHLRRVPVNL